MPEEMSGENSEATENSTFNEDEKIMDAIDRLISTSDKNRQVDRELKIKKILSSDKKEWTITWDYLLQLLKNQYIIVNGGSVTHGFAFKRVFTEKLSPPDIYDGLDDEELSTLLSAYMFLIPHMTNDKDRSKTILSQFDLSDSKVKLDDFTKQVKSHELYSYLFFLYNRTNSPLEVSISKNTRHYKDSSTEFFELLLSVSSINQNESIQIEINENELDKFIDILKDVKTENFVRHRFSSD